MFTVKVVTVVCCYPPPPTPLHIVFGIMWLWALPAKVFSAQDLIVKVFNNKELAMVFAPFSRDSSFWRPADACSFASKLVTIWLSKSYRQQRAQLGPATGRSPLSPTGG